MKRTTIFALVILALQAGAAQAQSQAPAGAASPSTQAPAANASTPDELIKNTFEEAKAIVKKTHDPRELRRIAEQKLLPYFDFAMMTRLAVGPGWRNATPAQQQALVDAFRSLLVNTYTSALNEASSLLDKTLEVKPVQTKGNDATVRTVVKGPGRPPVAIDYRMQNSSGWKVYDVVVEGVSLVTTYRNEFNEQVRKAGVDGLIKTLEAKNRSVASKS
jgi:phospholipid transport system substrate-binding protein